MSKSHAIFSFDYKSVHGRKIEFEKKYLDTQSKLEDTFFINQQTSQKDPF